jgi:hypothetical protein
MMTVCCGCQFMDYNRRTASKKSTRLKMGLRKPIFFYTAGFFASKTHTAALIPPGASLVAFPL